MCGPVRVRRYLGASLVVFAPLSRLRAKVVTFGIVPGLLVRTCACSALYAIVQRCCFSNTLSK